MIKPNYTMAAILSELNKPLVVDEVFLPDKIEFGQVLVKLHFSGICGSQIGEIEGRKGPDNYLPHLLGHEGSGIVMETGPGVSFVKPGDKVVLHWRKGNGIESVPPVYIWNKKKLNAGWVTTFNEYAVVSENRVTAFSEEIPMDIVSLLGCAVTTGLGVVINDARLSLGESVVVLGAGGVGLNIVQGAAMVSAYPIIAVDIHDSRLKLASKMGATHLINMRKQPDGKSMVKSILGKDGADVVIDNTGNTDLINFAYQTAGPSGRVVLVGVPPSGDNISIYSLDLHFGKKITGSHGGGALPASDIPKYIKLYQNGLLDLDSMITDCFSLRDINEAINIMKQGKSAGRCLIDLNN